MRVVISALCSAALLATAGCGGDKSRESPGSPDGDRSAAATPTDEETPAEALATAVEGLRELPAVSFKAGDGFGGRSGLSTEGIAVRGGAWSATTMLDVQDYHSTLRVRSIDGTMWAQDRSWKAPAAGCWVQIENGATPFDIAAQAAGLPQPGYLTLLDELGQAQWASALHDEVTAILPIRTVLSMFPADGGVDGVEGAESVRVRVSIDDGRVSQLLIHLSDIDTAIMRAGLPDPSSSTGDFRVYYDEVVGRATVARPAPDLVTGDLAAGCGLSA